MKRKYLYIIAALLWGVPGIIISVKGVSAYLAMPTSSLWWLFLITAAVLAGFFFMFSRIVDRYSARMAGQPSKTTVFQTFPLRGWILIVCMSCLGIALKYISGVPAEFTASFYSGLGPMLVYSACRFIFNGNRYEL